MTNRRDPVAAAEAALRDGRPWEARDRLTGYLGHHPDDLHAHALLGDAWWQMQDAARAGRYWFLTDREGTEVDQAVRAWRDTRRATDLARTLRVADTPERSYSAAALTRLDQLASDVAAEGAEWTPGRPLRDRAAARARRSGSRLLMVLLIIGALLATVGVWLVGIVALGTWLAG